MVRKTKTKYTPVREASSRLKRSLATRIKFDPRFSVKFRTNTTDTILPDFGHHNPTVQCAAEQESFSIESRTLSLIVGANQGSFCHVKVFASQFS